MVIKINFEQKRFIMMGPVFVFLLIFYNYFIISSLANILELGLNRNMIVAAVLTIALIHLIPMSIERKHSYNITSYLAEISQLILWAVFMYLFEIIFFKAVSLIVTLPLILRYFIVSLVPVFGVVGYFNAHNNKIIEHDIDFVERSPISNQVSIIHVSDIHIGSIRREKTLKRLVYDVNNIVNEKQLSGRDSLLVVSGDIADGSSPVLPDTFISLNDVKCPVIFVPGNHDYYQPIDDLYESLNNSGVIILDNDNRVYEKYGLNIIGLSYSFNEDSLSYKLPVSSHLNNVLVYHAPLYWEEFSKMGVDLELSGHTHGGQFYPANLWIKAVFPYLHGLYHKKVSVDDKNSFNSYLSVTDGVGTMGPPIRLGTTSEIVVLNINRINV